MEISCLVNRCKRLQAALQSGKATSATSCVTVELLPGAPGAVDAADENLMTSVSTEITIQAPLINHRGSMGDTRPVLRTVMGGGIPTSFSTSQSVTKL